MSSSAKQVVIAMLALFASLAACGGSEYSHEKVVEVAHDGIFTMSPTGSQPAYRYIGRYDRVYIGYFNSLNEIQILTYDRDANEFSPPVTLWQDWGSRCNGMLGDDHANPAIVVLAHQNDPEEKRKIVVASAEHGCRLDVVKSVNQEDIEQWHEPIQLMNEKATYARLIELNDGTLWLIVRQSWADSNARATFFYFVSNDSGASWSGPNILVDTDDLRDASSIYLTSYQDRSNSRIHFMFNKVVYDDPVKGVHRYQDVYYAAYDYISDLWLGASGATLASSTPLILSRADPVYLTDSTPQEEDWTYLSDIKVDAEGAPFLLSLNNIGLGFVSRQLSCKEAQIIRHSFVGGQWVNEVVGLSAIFNYTNMATFDQDDVGVVYGFEQNQYCYGELTRYRIGCDSEWCGERLTANTQGKSHARPFAVIDADDGYPRSRLRVLWSMIDENYPGSPYTEWESSIFALIVGDVMLPLVSADLSFN